LKLHKNDTFVLLLKGSRVRKFGHLKPLTEQFISHLKPVTSNFNRLRIGFEFFMYLIQLIDGRKTLTVFVIPISIPIGLSFLEILVDRENSKYWYPIISNN